MQFRELIVWLAFTLAGIEFVCFIETVNVYHCREGLVMVYKIICAFIEDDLPWRYG